MKCRVCGCDEQHACQGGCSWVHGEDICSVCQAAIDALRVYVERVYHIRTGTLIRELQDQLLRWPPPPAVRADGRPPLS